MTSLMNEFNPLKKHSYQHAFRVSSDFMNASLDSKLSTISLWRKT